LSFECQRAGRITAAVEVRQSIRFDASASAGCRVWRATQWFLLACGCARGAPSSTCMSRLSRLRTGSRGVATLVSRFTAASCLLFALVRQMAAVSASRRRAAVRWRMSRSEAAHCRGRTRLLVRRVNAAAVGRPMGPPPHSSRLRLRGAINRHVPLHDAGGVAFSRRAHREVVTRVRLPIARARSLPRPPRHPSLVTREILRNERRPARAALRGRPESTRCGRTVLHLVPHHALSCHSCSERRAGLSVAGLPGHPTIYPGGFVFLLPPKGGSLRLSTGASSPPFTWPRGWRPPSPGSSLPLLTVAPVGRHQGLSQLLASRKRHRRNDHSRSAERRDVL
jgi:hypothetical protein